MIPWQSQETIETDGSTITFNPLQQNIAESSEVIWPAVISTDPQGITDGATES